MIVEGGWTVISIGRIFIGSPVLWPARMYNSGPRKKKRRRKCLAESHRRRAICIYNRSTLCLKRSPVLGMGFSSLNAQSNRSSTGSNASSMPLHR